MKRILTAILAAALLLSLCACGKNGDPPGKNEPGATAAPGLTVSSVAGEPEQTASGESSDTGPDVSGPEQTEPEDDPAREPEDVEWPPKPTASPDGQPVTEGFMAENDFSDVLEKLYSTKWKLKQGDYYQKDIAPIVNGNPRPVSTVEFRRDMTAHFTFSDGCYGDVDEDANYRFDDGHAILVVLPDMVLPVVCIPVGGEEDSLAFAFDNQGRLWAFYEPHYPLQNFFIGLFEPV